jgi:hypothetical protein
VLSVGHSVTQVRPRPRRLAWWGAGAGAVGRRRAQAA